MGTHIDRRNFIRAGATGAAAGALGLVGHAQQPQPEPAAQVPGSRTKAGAEFITPDTQAAIERGLGFLARNQLTDGSFGEPTLGTGVGIASLAALALMAGGNQPGRGRFGKNVARAVEYVAGMAGGPNPGFLTAPASQAAHRLNSNPAPMYSHGFGTLFLSEVCGMVPAAARDAKLRGALEQAVAFTVFAQNTLGGWRYEPQVQYADVSVTTAQMMALRAAKNAGVFVRKSVIDGGAAYIKGCQLADGGFSYWKGQGFSAFARTAASIVGLYSAGIYEGREVERGLKYLQQFTPGRQFSPREIPPQHYWYGQYYAALAMWTAGDDYWNAWLPAIRDELLAKARTGGGTWNDPYHGSVYATAMALIVLQLPNNYLPILQK
ncbi:Prenyltransferase-like protein OS=uncultured bacterium PE=4 SV=1: Prenyltrans_1 [Gemmataceae bacterium]|nr:Prenyltransferase-like protein OS=uncultured bacterium PE=4 SV=1: Prenyltrans_1 [Gemmataceae bacterium]VTT98507.1 Prenyltransferase-like protein OS=uncultured bacterium PE=4 SV=1: Prenyltrans_1 [Gemmataceae bacterium]